MADQGDQTNNVELLPDDSVYVSRLMPNAFYYISGGIAKPGKMVYERPLTLTQAIMEQGGPLPFAKMKEGRVFRHTEGDGDPKKTKIITFNLRDIERGKKPDIAIMPGDTIWIAPGAAPTRPPWDIFQALNFVSQVTFIYNQLSGRGFGFNGGSQ
jgi:protein involved in polysaccharide export with SLBB domain